MSSTTLEVTANEIALSKKAQKLLNNKCYLWFWGCVITQTLIAFGTLAILKIVCNTYIKT